MRSVAPAVDGNLTVKHIGSAFVAVPGMYLVRQEDARNALEYGKKRNVLRKQEAVIPGHRIWIGMAIWTIGS